MWKTRFGDNNMLNNNNENEKTKNNPNIIANIIEESSENERISAFFKIKAIIYYLLGVIEVLLMFRLVFKSLGASAKNGFVALIYYISQIFLLPFEGIFNTIITRDTLKSIFEPATIIAMIVYAILSIGLVRLIHLSIVKPKY